MTSVCISNCLNDARDPRVPVRATYVNLYKWPESDAEFVKSVSSNGRKGSSQSQMYGHTRVVDSISCRQMYLRSYKFSRKESVPEKTQKCFGRVKEKVANGKKKKPQVRKRKCLVWKKAKEISCSALFRIFHKFLSCAASVDVVDERG
ncbi:Protein unc-80 like [Quillaja saponaria]|uniref:Protein unc-80 like n=1 Tax=Quillaja saponaria TaxID=32244 RepID=A0AAD7Q8Y1_QUISA|nr:Protein unc-80 like [Quillaja saponaria]